MPLFDTSSIIYAWDNYPIEMFPPLWKWLENEISTEEIVFPFVVKGEIERNSPDCSDWVNDRVSVFLSPSQAILEDALRIKKLIGIVEDKYGDGVGENDLIIIATARSHQLDLVSNENKQIKLPVNKARYKIPAVCALPEIDVACQSFLEFLRQSSQVFQA